MTIEILVPVNKPEDLHAIKNTNCRAVFVYHNAFIKNTVKKNHQSDQTTFSNQEKLIELANSAENAGIKLYINFRNDFEESEIARTENIFAFIKSTESLKISGIMANSPSIIKIAMENSFKGEIIIDSGFNIHNIAGAEFVFSMCNPDVINITEEIHIKNLEKIKKITKCRLATDSNNLKWIAQDIIENRLADMIIIKADFRSPNELLEGIKSVEDILKSPNSYKNKKLPFKNIENFEYKTDHFSCEFQNSRGRSFKFSGNIHRLKPDYKRFFIKKRVKLPVNIEYPCLNLRLTSLSQLAELKKYLKKYLKLHGNPVKAVEYGEIINTADLAKHNFNTIIDRIKQECQLMGVQFKLGTPRILTERDFDRVYEYTKTVICKDPLPSAVVVNNLGYWWNIVNDREIFVPIELGGGLNIKNSTNIELFQKIRSIKTVDFSNFSETANIKTCIEKLNVIHMLPDSRQITIAGSSRVPATGLCPLNNDSAVLSRLSCPAPCHKGTYFMQDKMGKKCFHLAVDGFCRVHMFRDKMLDLFKYISVFQQAGINEFMIDFSSLSEKLVPVLLDKYIDSLENQGYLPDENFISNEYGIEKYLTQSGY